MKSVKFSLENIREIEEFTGTTLEAYFQIGKPTGKFLFPKEEGESDYNRKKLELTEGEEVFKDEAGNIFKKVN